MFIVNGYLMFIVNGYLMFIVNGYLMFIVNGYRPNSALHAFVSVFLCMFNIILQNSACRASIG